MSSSALTYHEASSYYGSAILICLSPKKEEVTLPHWALIKKYPKKKGETSKDMIFDQISRRSYPVEDCNPFQCSPEPWRLNGCELKQVK